MAKQYLGWNKLNQLGNEYHQLVQQGYGLSAETRNKRQEEIARLIIENSIDFLYKIANSMVYGRGGHISNRTISLSQEKRISSMEFDKKDNSIEKELSLDDLVNDASIFIIKRMHKYEPNKSQISTFIGYMTVIAMYKSARESLGLVKLPVHVYETVKRCMRLRNKKTGEGLTKSQIIKKLADRNGGYKIGGINTAFLAYMTATGKYVSLDEPAPDFKMDNSPCDEKVEGTIPDEKAKIAEEEVIAEELAKKTARIFNTLMPKESYVLEKRFGIGRRDDITYEDVARGMETTRERIRQIEAKALRKLRHPCRSKKLRAFVEE